MLKRLWFKKISFESNSFLDLMNGKKTRDFYYMQLQNLSGFGNISEADFDSINKCIKTAKVYRMLEDNDSDIDMTRCAGESQQRYILQSIIYRASRLPKQITLIYTVPKLSLKLYEAYRVCRKEPDWSNDVPLVTTAAPTTPEANPTTVASTESPITDVTNAPIENLPDFNNLSQVSNY